MPQLISISEAKQRLLELARRNEDFGESFVLLKDSVPVSALIPFEEYEAMLETLHLLEEDPKIANKLRQAEKEINAGEYTVWKPKSSQVAEKSKTYKSKK